MPVALFVVLLLFHVVLGVKENIVNCPSQAVCYSSNREPCGAPPSCGPCMKGYVEGTTGQCVPVDSYDDRPDPEDHNGHDPAYFDSYDAELLSELLREFGGADLLPTHPPSSDELPTDSTEPDTALENTGAERSGEESDEEVEASPSAAAAAAASAATRAPGDGGTDATGSDGSRGPVAVQPAGVQQSAARSSHMEVQKKDVSGAHPARSSNFVFIAVVSACVAACLVGVAIAAVCWYKLQKSVKATGDIDYPGYGIRGPSMDKLAQSPSDRSLSQSAEMYHYQHQKQQMLAMRKSDAGAKDGASDGESDYEHEENDYTVYECPGLATTGEMEVPNPLFKEDETSPVNKTPPVGNAAVP